ncbi:MAG: hypothetical protein FWE25_00620 [Lachnospiraceae bacterium]|nr:hypothetical protein [Lachnospiraceae bacterium]
MLDKNRIKLMIKMSSYEQSAGKEYLKISTYYKKDYVSLNTLITVLWVTLGYMLSVGLFIVVTMDSLLQDLTFQRIINTGAIIAGAYFVVLIIFCIVAAIFYSNKHKKAKQHIKRYYHDLSHLEKMMSKETKRR